MEIKKKMRYFVKAHIKNNFSSLNSVLFQNTKDAEPIFSSLLFSDLKLQMLLFNFKFFLFIIPIIFWYQSVGVHGKFLHSFDNQNNLKRNPEPNRNKCSQAQRHSIFGNHLVVNQSNPLKVDLIREFLSIKYLQNFDLIARIMSSDSQHETFDLKGH